MLEDERLKELFTRWKELSWLKKKHIEWCRLRHKYRFSTREVIAVVVGLYTAGVLLFETHTKHKIGLLSVAVLFSFYGLAIEQAFKILRPKRLMAKVEFSADGTILSTSGGDEFKWDRLNVIGMNISQINPAMADKHRLIVSEIVHSGKKVSGATISHNGVFLEYIAFPIFDDQGNIEKLEAHLYKPKNKFKIA